jgi:hypothetical protein
VTPDGLVTALWSEPHVPDLAAVLKEHTNHSFRSSLSRVLPDDPLLGGIRLLLDDVPAALFISQFALAQWHPIEELLTEGTSLTSRRILVGICTGLAPGSSGLRPDGTSRWIHKKQVVPELASDADSLGWHELAVIDAMSMRRARRIEVWEEAGVIHVDAMFQDSATRPQGGRVAVHEYTLTASIDVETMTLRSLAPVPRVLPYAECPLAVRGVTGLIGTPLTGLRQAVSKVLPGIAGCSHLNDAVRALADAPRLYSRLSPGAQN